MAKNKNAASEDTLSILHSLTAEYIRKRLELALNGDEPLPPAELSAIAKFLKDNNIECTVDDMQERFGEIIRLDIPKFDQKIEEMYG